MIDDERRTELLVERPARKRSRIDLRDDEDDGDEEDTPRETPPAVVPLIEIFPGISLSVLISIWKRTIKATDLIKLRPSTVLYPEEQSYRIIESGFKKTAYSLKD